VEHLERLYRIISFKKLHKDYTAGYLMRFLQGLCKTWCMLYHCSFKMWFHCSVQEECRRGQYIVCSVCRRQNSSV